MTEKRRFWILLSLLVASILLLCVLNIVLGRQVAVQH